MKVTTKSQNTEPSALAHAIAAAQSEPRPPVELEDMIDTFVMGSEPRDVGKHAAAAFRKSGTVIDVLMAYRDNKGVPSAVPRRYEQAADEISKSVAKTKS